ncbi:tetratricopeptide repeat protein [Vibrio gallaecicus]|uniref:tetratricopeptide repeat protein n=2 Tax=Vibrio gallaecicus TaxID=552386 RepID=UPI0025B55D06|nr:hypothetical protein [Vibrio gallaecicus]MDN3614655.1 hypothetical protein [Vibrio gallaecicus]MDN3615914.1 hypothetical protein [Vibrio gallaecicus]MDN3615939.1 hypothetical protein [Vibrio gallaecicus]
MSYRCIKLKLNQLELSKMTLKLWFVCIMSFLCPFYVGASAVQPADFPVPPVEREESLLAEYSQNELLSMELRVEATSNLGMYYGPNAIIAVARASRSEHTEMRLAAIQAAKQWEGRAKWDVISPMLNDNNQDVSEEAVQVLIQIWQILSPSHQEYLDKYVGKYLEKLPLTLEGDLKKTWFYRIQRKEALIEEQYERMYTLYDDPRIAVLHAGYLRDIGKTAQSREVLEKAAGKYPKDAYLQYSLGLSYHRSGDLMKSKQSLSQAVALAPANSKYAYVYASTVRDSDVHQAARLFGKAYQLNQEPVYLYALCDALLESKQNAKPCLDSLKRVAPESVVTELKKRY